MRQNVFAIILICLLMSGCGAAVPLPTRVTPINRSQAFEAAKESCSQGHIQQIDPPQLVEARLMGYKQARAILNCPDADCAASSPTSEPDQALVWLVTLEGRWQLVGGPLPVMTPTPIGQPPVPTSGPISFHHCRTMVDATTGVADSNQLFQ